MFPSRRASFVVPRDGNNPRLLVRQPGEGDLRGRRLLLLRDPGQQIDQRLIRLARFRREARDDVAEVRFTERRVRVDLSGEKAFAQGTELSEADAEWTVRRPYVELYIRPNSRPHRL